jgi:alpha-tubulin suppressor-like RCC1 family protein
VWSWGFGRNGELGLGSETNTSLPQPIKNVKFVDIESRKSISAGITVDGKLLTWGKNRNGVLGHLPPNLNVLIPNQLEFNEKITQVSCGPQHMCVIT